MKALLKALFAATVLGALVAGCGGGGNSEISASDLIRPEISQTLPANGASNVGTTTPIIITFSEAMNEDSVKSAFSLTGGTNAGTLIVSGSTATFTPSPITPLSPNTNYTATIAATAKDGAGNSLVKDHVWTFTTGSGPDVTPPTVQSYAPAGSSVGINTTIAISFSEPMKAESVRDAVSLTKGLTTIPCTFSLVGETAVLKPNAPLDHSTPYRVTITDTAKDLAGNGLAAPVSWDFTTSPPPPEDLVKPTVVDASLSPGRNAINVPRDSPISVSFSEPITPFEYGSINGYPTRVEIDYTTNTATMRPTTLLKASTEHTVVIRVKDLAGNLSELVTWKFTTGTAPTAP